MPDSAGAVTAAAEPSFARTQRAFAAHIRDPERCPAPAAVEDRRMAIYRDLFVNNLSSLLESSFPVLRRLLTDAHWRVLIRDFLIRHRCQTPLFAEIAQEFLDFLGNERGSVREDPPFLLELAHYEWVELALGLAEDKADPALTDPNGDLMAGLPAISPLAWNLSYRFPVHRIGPDYQPREPGEHPTHLLVYRNRQDRVEFLEINTVTQRLLQLLRERPGQTGLEIVEAIAMELKHPRPQQVIDAGRQLMEDLRARHVILGTRR
jgi:hypothetical protein